MVHVELFPTQAETDGLFVIVLAPTGVAYNNQCGGTNCVHQEAEGFLVPVGTPDDLAAVRDWFWRRFGGACWCDGRLAADPSTARDLAEIVAGVRCWAGGHPAPLQLDAERLPDGCEAWVPVQSPFGPGWLTWINSD